MIVEIAQLAGIELHGNGDKRQLCCPFHDDSTPSAFVSVPHNVFFCSVCTPGGGWTAKKLAEQLHVSWPLMPREGSCPPRATPGGDRPVLARAFGPEEAAMTWETARARVYNDRWDTHIPVDHVVYEYLRSRHLEETWEARSFGILASDQPLHSAVRHWPREGYRLIAPVFDQTAKLVNVQGRAILARTPKTLFPKGSRAWGTMFASREALELLRGSWTGPKCVVLGEGMTDFLAFAILCSVPVICSPGTGVAARSVGAWAKDCAILLALDADQAGENAIAPIARQAFEFGAKRVRRLVWPRRCKDACDALVAVGAVGLADFLDEQAQGVVL